MSSKIEAFAAMISDKCLRKCEGDILLSGWYPSADLIWHEDVRVVLYCLNPIAMATRVMPLILHVAHVIGFVKSAIGVDLQKT